MKDRILAHYGMADYYKYFCQQYPELNVSKEQFKIIVEEFNKELAKDLVENLSIQLPSRLGKIEIVKEKRKAYINKEGQVVNNIPVDWKKTKQLWANDKEAKERKILIRYNNTHTNGYVFRTTYNKSRAVFTNKSIYFFRPVRSLSRSIARRIKDYSKDKYDAYLKK